MTQDEIRERKLREAQETRNRLRSANQEQQVAGRRGKYRNQKPSPTMIPATIDRDLDPEGSFTMLNVPAESAATQQEQQFLLEQLLHLSSSGITGQEARRAIVRMFPNKQQKIKVSKAVRTFARHDAEDLNNTGRAAECPCVDRQNR